MGFRAVDDLRNLPEVCNFVDDYDDEDIWQGRVIHIVTAIGMCLIRCQQIEHYIVNSFLLGISKKQKAKYDTINDLRDGWKKKTLGNMIKSIEEAWEINPMIKQGLDLFLDMRNRLVHGLTMDQRFDIRTEWGQKELWSFLYLFDVHSRIIKIAFRASYYASLKFAIMKWGPLEGMPKKIFNKKQEDELNSFFEFFTMKEDFL